MHLFHKLKDRTFFKPRATNSRLHRVGRDPYMDWQIIFFTSLLLGVVVVIVGVSVYFRADKFLSTEVSVFTAPIQAQADINNLKYILGEFADNERKQSSLQKGYVGVADPSR